MDYINLAYIIKLLSVWADNNLLMSRDMYIYLLLLLLIN